MEKIKNIFGLLLVAMIFICSTSVAFAETNDNVDNVIDLDEGTKIASFYLIELSNTFSELEDWSASSVEHEMTYYDLNGEKTAYVFDVVKNDVYQGYLLISSTKNNYPILEFSNGKLPHMKSEIKETSQEFVANYATKNSLSTQSSIPVYGGATFYYDEYKLVDKQGKLEKRIIVDLQTKNIIDITEIEFSNLRQEKNKSDNEEIKEAWKNLETRMNENICSKPIVSTKGSIGYIYDVPFEEWYLGCAPTAAAMVLEYWDENGYSNLPYGTSLIEDLADAMGTTNGATTVSMIDDGIEDVCDDNGYSNFNAINDDNVFMSETMTEIDADRPFVLSMQDGGIGSGYTNPYNNHSVACVGYSEGTTDYLFLHDTWDDEHHHYITFGNWDDATATWVRP